LEIFYSHRLIRGIGHLQGLEEAVVVVDIIMARLRKVATALPPSSRSTQHRPLGTNSSILLSIDHCHNRGHIRRWGGEEDGVSRDWGADFLRDRHYIYIYSMAILWM
jgi:hypothetical protein